MSLEEKIKEALRRKDIREDEETNAAIDAMMSSFDEQEGAYIGPFWYDTEKKELFGVVRTLAQDRPFFKSPQYKAEIRTGSALHSDIWRRESKREKDKRFSGDYTQVPRGRVFEFKDKGFIVFTGEWIDDHPEAKKEIIDEFNLPPNTEFRKDRH